MRKLCLLIFAVIAPLLLTSCADTAPTKPDNSGSQVSAIPWNRPEHWEGTGSFPGGMGTQ